MKSRSNVTPDKTASEHTCTLASVCSLPPCPMSASTVPSSHFPLSTVVEPHVAPPCSWEWSADSCGSHEIGHLEEAACDFSGAGCDGRFRREDEEEYTRQQNTQKHLTLTAYLAMETKDNLQLKILEQDKEHKWRSKRIAQMMMTRYISHVDEGKV